MKLFTMILVLHLVMVRAQNPDFVDEMLRLHQESAASFDLISYMIESTHDSVLSYLIQFNVEAVKEITQGLKTINTLQDQTQLLIESATGSEACIQVAVENWEIALNRTGPLITSCALEHHEEVRKIQEGINAEYVQQRRALFTGQNLMLNAFSEINIVTSQQELKPFVDDEAARVSQNFFISGMFELYRHLDYLAEFVSPALQEIKGCVQAVTSRLSDEAIVVANTLELC